MFDDSDESDEEYTIPKSTTTIPGAAVEKEAVVPKYSEHAAESNPKKEVIKQKDLFDKPKSKLD